MEELYAFSSERKMASVLVKEADGLVLYNKARTLSFGLAAHRPLSMQAVTFYMEAPFKLVPAVKVLCLGSCVHNKSKQVAVWNC